MKNYLLARQRALETYQRAVDSFYRYRNVDTAPSTEESMILVGMLHRSCARVYSILAQHSMNVDSAWRETATRRLRDGGRDMNRVLKKLEDLGYIIPGESKN